LCEDYVGRTSGIPDLLAWDVSKKKAKFVEVKG
jgi:Fanconi-associated nuclease 1